MDIKLWWFENLPTTNDDQWIITKITIKMENNIEKKI